MNLDVLPSKRISIDCVSLEEEVDKLWDALLKVIPPYFLLALGGIALSFLSVYYWRGYRNYADAFRDVTFLTLAVVLLAGAALYGINREESSSTSEPPLVLVPYFRNDESDQVRSAFGTQFESGLVSLYPRRRTVIYVNSFITDEMAAAATAERYRSTAVLYAPIVMRDKETTASFKIYFASSKITQPYAIVPLNLPRDLLNDIALRITGSERHNDSAPSPLAPLIARLERLESTMAGLQATVATSRGSSTQPASGDYGKKHALVVASNGPEELPKLQSAEQDGKELTEALHGFGFQVTSLIGGGATRAATLQELVRLAPQLARGDLLIFYFTGHSYLRQNEQSLSLILSDFRSDRASGAIEASELRRLLMQSGAGHILVILDASYGKAGFAGNAGFEPEAPRLEPAQGRAQPQVITVLTGTADSEAGMETTAGGIFSRALIATLGSVASGSGMSTQDLYRAVASRMQASTQYAQHPQLYSIGSGEIVLRRP